MSLFFLPLTVLSWSPKSWTAFKRYQMPLYQNEEHLMNVKNRLSVQSPLVFAGEAENLKHHIARATIGKSFVLIGGDCAESFDDFSVEKIKNDFNLILKLCLILMYGAGKPVAPIGRIAGQFAKPRSSDFETRGNIVLPVYRGDIVNNHCFTAEDRFADPENMIRAYHQSSQTLNLLRAFMQGGYSNLYNHHFWPLTSNEKFINQMKDALFFMESMGFDKSKMKLKHFYTGHECLLLDYEECLTRIDSITGKYYDCSAHFLWVGERTRSLDSAQIEFIKGIHNPIGIKISEDISSSELIALLNELNPSKEIGRITVITRMGRHIHHVLPELIARVQEKKHPVCWVCDPMHANTYEFSGVKTRHMDSILAELQSFFQIHQQQHSIAGGIHLEMTHKNVTECLGHNVAELKTFYDSKCDPRLNEEQTVQTAFVISEILQKQRH